MNTAAAFSAECHRTSDVVDARMLQVTAAIVGLLLVAAGAGLFLEPYVDETQFARNGYRGADLVSLLLAVPVLIGGAIAAHRGSTRGLLLWLGGLGYVAYQYSYTFAYGWSRLFLVYLALLSLAAFTLTAALTRVDARAVVASADAAAPVRRVAGFVTVIGVALGSIELGQIVPALLTGDTPKIVEDTAHPTSPVFVLDLGFVVPLLLLTGHWLRCHNPWGYVTAAIVLIKGVTVGAGLLAANVFAVVDAGTNDGPLNVLWAAIAFGSATALVQFLRHIHDEAAIAANTFTGPSGVTRDTGKV